LNKDLSLWEINSRYFILFSNVYG